MAYENLAYNLERYNYNEDSSRHIGKDDLIVVKSKPKKLSFKAKALFYIVGLALVVVIISTQLSIHEVSQKVLAANKQLEEMESEGIRLSMELEAKGSKRNIEQQAGVMFGLSEENRGQVEYININKENKAVVKGDNKNIFDNISDAFNSLMEYIRNMFNNN